MNCGQINQPEGGLWPDDNDMNGDMPTYSKIPTMTDQETELIEALKDIASTILVVHPSVLKDNGWIEEIDVVRLRQIARDVLEKYKIQF